MYILVPFIFFIWGGLTIAYCQFDFHPEWLVTLMASADSDNPADAFFLTTRGGLVLIGVGVFCLIWIYFILLPSSDTSADSSSLKEDTKTSDAPEYMYNEEGCSYRILERRPNGDIRLDNDDIVHTSDGRTYYGLDRTEYFLENPVRN